MARTVLVTGGAGFVGSSLALRLKEWHPDWSVIALDNLRRRGSELNLERLRAGGVAFKHGDIRNPEDFPGGALDAVVECAAEPSVQAGYGESPRYVLNSNLLGLVNCLELARERGASLLFLSTSRVYPMEPLNALRFREDATRFTLLDEQEVPGASSRGVSEAFPLAGARSIYGATKLCGELLVEEYRAAYGLPAVVNRCGVIAGPWQMGKVDQGVFTLWVAAHLFRRPLSYIGWGGAGKQVRDLLHVDDLCELVDHQLQSVERYSGEVFNVGGGAEISLSLLETTQLCEELTGVSLGIRGVAENRSADVRIYLSDCSRLFARTEWRPSRSAATVLEDTYRWIVDHRDALQPVLAG